MANWIRDSVDAGDAAQDGDWGIVAPTFGDARDVCVEGPSGLLRALGGEGGGYVRTWNRSHGEVFLENGARVYLDGADDGADRVQGKNLRGAWCDEVGLWRATNWVKAWNESLSFAVRLAPSRIIATGTPKQGHPLVKHLLTAPRTVSTRMRLYDNIANLHPDAVADLHARFADSRLGRQELEGEFLEDAPGALWTTELLEKCRLGRDDWLALNATLTRVVVGVDPSGAADENTGNAEIGIVVVGFSAEYQHAYVLEDASLRGGPERWGAEVRRCYREHKADVVVAEKNFGGDMVRYTIQALDGNVNTRLVSASRGKAPRAEPVAVKYDQGKVYHVGSFPQLESQMTTWVPTDPNQPSPDRVDALVWALTELFSGSHGVQYKPRGAGPEPVLRQGDLTLIGAKYVDRK